MTKFRISRVVFTATVGVTLMLGACSQKTGAPEESPQATARTAQIANLEARADRVKDANDIKRLQRAYGFYVDKGEWDQVADLFAPDASVEYANEGVYVGQERIREYLKRLGGGHNGLAEGVLNNHMILQPVVHVAPDGLTAKGRWRALIQEGHYKKDAQWGEGTYENEYVKEEGVWKIRRVHWYVGFLAPYQGGWAKVKPLDAFVGDVVKDFPADKPPTNVYKPYPAAYVPPYHYENPVTGFSAVSAPPTANTDASLAPWEIEVARVEAHDAVENLQAIYGYYFDKNQWDQVADQVERLANPRLSFVHTALFDFVRRIVGEQTGDLVPLVLVEVVAIDGLQILDRVMRFETRNFELPRSKRCIGGRRASHGARCTGNRVLVVIGRHERSRVRFVVDGGRLVWRELLHDVADECVLRFHFRPAAFIRRDEAHVPVKLPDLPDSALFHVLVLVGAFAPRGGLLELALLHEGAPAALRGLPIRRHVHDGLQEHVVVHLPFDEPVVPAAKLFEVFAYAVLADIDAFIRIFDGSVGREQIRHLVPLGLVEVEAVGALKSFDVVGVFHAISARLECGNLRGTRAGLLRPGGPFRLLRAGGQGERRAGGNGKSAGYARTCGQRIRHGDPPETAAKLAPAAGAADGVR